MALYLLGWERSAAARRCACLYHFQTFIFGRSGLFDVILHDLVVTILSLVVVISIMLQSKTYSINSYDQFLLQ